MRYHGLCVGLLILFLLAPSYVSAAKPNPWDNVRVTGNDEDVERCLLIDEVRGGDHFYGGIAAGTAEKKAFKRIKKNAYEMGADTVLMMSGGANWSGAVYRGEAYLCNPDETSVAKANNYRKQQGLEPLEVELEEDLSEGTNNPS